MRARNGRCGRQQNDDGYGPLGSRRGQQRLQSAQLFMTIVCFSLAAIMTPSVLFIPMPGFMTMDKRIALAALSCGVLLGVFSGLPDAVYRATGRYALGTMLGNLIRIGGWAGSIIGLILFRSFAGVALAGSSQPLSEPPFASICPNRAVMAFCSDSGTRASLNF
jgi:hypothetical protein